MKLIDHDVCGNQVGAGEEGTWVAGGAGSRPALEARGRIPTPVRSRPA